MLYAYRLLESHLVKSIKSFFNPKSDSPGEVDDADINLVEDIKNYLEMNAEELLPYIEGKLIFDKLPDGILVSSEQLNIDDKVNTKDDVISLVHDLKDRFRLRSLRIVTMGSSGNSYILMSHSKSLKFVVKIGKRFEISAIPNY